MSKISGPEFSNEALARIVAEAVVYLDTNPDATVMAGLNYGALVESFLYGHPSEANPVGILGVSPLDAFRKTQS